MEVAFDAETESALEAFEFADAHAAEFGKAVAEIAKSEKNVGVFRIEFGNKPSRTRLPDRRI